MTTPEINWAVYKSLPPAEAQYQLDHVHESRVRDIASAHIICLTILAVAIILRFIARRMSKTAIKADDWMIVAALVFEIGQTISVLLCVLRFGGGRHAILLTHPIPFAQSVLAAEVFYPPAIASIKISTLLLYTRIFPSRGFRLLLYTIGLFVATYSAIMVLGAIFQCVPVRGGWDTTVKAKCIQINLLWMIMAGMNVLTDFVLVLAPLPTLWGLQMRGVVKAQVMGVFCVGGLYVVLFPSDFCSVGMFEADIVFGKHSVCAISIYRIPKLHGLSLHDASWSNADTAIWSVVEICVAVVCACAIVYRPLFGWVLRIRVYIATAATGLGSGSASGPSASGSRFGRDVSTKGEKLEMGAWEGGTGGKGGRVKVTEGEERLGGAESGVERKEERWESV